MGFTSEYVTAGDGHSLGAVTVHASGCFDPSGFDASEEQLGVQQKQTALVMSEQMKRRIPCAFSTMFSGVEQ
jgi:hypothetical protein